MAVRFFWRIELFSQRVVIANKFLTSLCGNEAQCVTEHLKDSKEFNEVIGLKSKDAVYYFEVYDEGEITLSFAISEDELLEEILHDEEASEYDFDALIAF